MIRLLILIRYSFFDGGPIRFAVGRMCLAADEQRGRERLYLPLDLSNRRHYTQPDQIRKRNPLGVQFHERRH